MAFTIDMNRCPGCAHKANCTNRKKMVQVLSGLAMELNSDEMTDGPGDGTIIVHCQYDAK